ncbi:glycosyltransferase [Altererythrobacter sp.]|nr:glycosyltransferase [Altererythrobacter sp.]
MIERVIIYAPNVGGGGGLVLLKQLLATAWEFDDKVAILDNRGRDGLAGSANQFRQHWFDSSVAGRWRAERALSRLADDKSLVLCFHNLPPLLANNAVNLCYVQNANLVGLIPADHLSGWLRFRCFIERGLARLFCSRIDQYIVQTPTMAQALENWFGPGIPPVAIWPFTDQAARTEGLQSMGADTAAEGMLASAVEPSWEFLYVSDGPAHKNHKRLFDAWKLLGAQGLYPSLAVTLHPERDSALASMVGELANAGLRIYDLGQIPHTEVMFAYSKARALIFPSYAESFGIPLLEAAGAGLPILASELDYVRDVCEPVETFDPFSSRSIARAIRRFLGAAHDRVELLPPVEVAARIADIARIVET